MVGDLTFGAAFDTGSLARVERNRYADGFVVWARADCEGAPARRKTRTWFFFSIRGHKPGRVLKIEVRMSNQAKLFQHGMRPVYRSLPSKPEWSRLNTPTPPNDAASADGFGIHINHTVDTPAGETLYLAFCFPHGYAESMATLAWADLLFRQPVATFVPPAADEDDATLNAHYWEQARKQLDAAADAYTSSWLDRVVKAITGSAAPAASAVTAGEMEEYRRQRLYDAARGAALSACIPPTTRNRSRRLSHAVWKGLMCALRRRSQSRPHSTRRRCCRWIAAAAVSTTAVNY